MQYWISDREEWKKRIQNKKHGENENGTGLATYTIAEKYSMLRINLTLLFLLISKPRGILPFCEVHSKPYLLCIIGVKNLWKLKNGNHQIFRYWLEKLEAWWSTPVFDNRDIVVAATQRSLSAVKTVREEPGEMRGGLGVCGMPETAQKAIERTKVTCFSQESAEEGAEGIW